MPRVGLNIVEEAPNDITDRCSHRSDPGNIDTQAGSPFITLLFGPSRLFAVCMEGDIHPGI